MKLFSKKNKATRAKRRFLRNRKSTTPRNEDNEDSDDWIMPRDLMTSAFDSSWNDDVGEQDEVDEQDEVAVRCAQVLVMLFLTVSLICCIGFVPRLGAFSVLISPSPHVSDHVQLANIYSHLAAHLLSLLSQGLWLALAWVILKWGILPQCQSLLES